VEKKKSVAQLNREIAEALAEAEIKPISESSYLGGLRYKTETYGPGGNRPIAEALSPPKVADPSAKIQAVIQHARDAERKLAKIARTRRPTAAETAEAHAAYAAAAQVTTGTKRTKR
jgi:hypothetical protein